MNLAIKDYAEKIDALREWEQFYKTHFGLNLSFETIMLPQKPVFECALEVVPKCISKTIAFNRAKELFPTRLYYKELEKSIPRNARQSLGRDYAFWVNIGSKPDAQFLGQSAMAADPSMRIGMNFLERTILEIKYFIETGMHLDTESMTLCSGSRYHDGGIPAVCWGKEGFEVYTMAPVYPHPRYGIRKVFM